MDIINVVDVLKILGGTLDLRPDIHNGSTDVTSTGDRADIWHSSQPSIPLHDARRQNLAHGNSSSFTPSSYCNKDLSNLFYGGTGNGLALLYMHRLPDQ